ncbi:MAG: ABC transporter permease [Acutalibacteraceae bacterium]
MVIKNLLNFAKENLKIFIIFLLVQIITLVAFLSVFNYGLKFAEDAKQRQTQCRTYSFSVSDFDALDEQMEKFYTKYSDKLAQFYAVIQNGENKILAVYTSDYYDSYITNGKNLSANDLKNGAKKMVAKTEMSMEKSNYTIDSYYELQGEKYQVIGTTLGGNFMIPYNSLTDKSVITKIDIITNCDMTNLQMQNFSNSIKNTFPCENLQQPTSYDLNIYTETFKYILMFGVVIVVALFNIIYLYSYMLNRRKHHFAVMRICGCNISQAVNMYYGEILLLSVFIYIVALILHLFCVMPIMTSLSETIQYYISFGQYILIYLFYIAVETVSFIPIIKKFSKTSPSVLSKD